MRLVLTADTHVPTAGPDTKRSGERGGRGAGPTRRDLPAELWAAVDAADVVVHAGDWMAPALLDAFEERSACLVGCWGNNDSDEMRARLPEVARAELDGVRLAVVHETGGKEGRERRCDAWFGPDSHAPADLLVFGHSHIPWDATTPSGLRLLNPGSPTERRRQPTCTYMTTSIIDGVLGPVELHPLPSRASGP